MAQTEKITNNNAGKSMLSEILFKYLPYWPLFVIFLILSLFTAWFYLRTSAPMYEITASIMLKDEKKGASDGEIRKELNQIEDNKIVENEIEVIQSRTVMQNVVKNLHLYASIYEEDKLIPRSAYNTSPILVTAYDPDQLTSNPKVQFSYNAKESIVSIGTHKYPMNSFVKTPYGEFKFIPNPHQLGQPQSSLYFTLNSPKVEASNLLGMLRATASTKLATVLSLKLKDPDPRRGEDILNELFVVYNKAAADDKNRLAANTTAFVDERLKSVEKQLADIEKKGQSFKSSQNAVDIGTQGQLFLQSVNANDQKLADINMQLSVLDQVEGYVKSKDKTQGIVPSTLGLADPSLPKLVTSLYEEESKYEKMKLTVGENHPQLLAIKDQITKLQPGLLENIQNQRASLKASMNQLQTTNHGYNNTIASIPQKEKELIDISRQQAVLSNLFLFLTQKKTDALLSVNHESEARIIDKAQASFGPVSPKSKLIYMVTIILAMIIPVALISAKELFNRKILFRHEIEQLTNAPIIGEIIFDRSKDPVVIQEGKRTFIAEQFRRMRTSLGYLGGTSGKKKLLITSSLSGEGKSFVALNLAQSLALTSRKVVLVELDLVNPSLSNKLNVSYEMGASNYLMGECEPEDIIKRTAVNSNLFFLPAGPLQENPSELLMSEKINDLLKYLEDVFDVIIIDSAPASLLSDAYVLSPLADMTLYVVKHKFTPKTYIEKLDMDNNGNSLKNMRIVFNGIRSRGFTKNGYGYGYGYGYIHDNSSKKKKQPARSKR